MRATGLRFRQRLAALALGLLPALGAAQTVEASSGFVTGHTVHRGGKQHYTLLTHVAYKPDGGLPGGAASFGFGDDGRVLLLGYAKYVPRLVPAQVQRRIRTPKPPLDEKQLPRFMMLCVWPLEGGKPGKVLAGYVERDDANISVHDSKFSIEISSRWESIPERRAPRAFFERDYCGEIAKAGASSAPTWLLDDVQR